ncbi:hypothetical protein GE21DRAFT_2074 [Neurospora crassa]|uniref:Protein png-1 n=2 Tax=Neurospora crassa TaxID=5141 RepID=PNG1_NEUCR|nr:transglutaminase-like protein, variant 1 [Neurospora crassa OR74A]XP_011392803.1 transglutaminase-like protein [Neurospora crassa OR74A]XP_011392804.1 transglutaminase-like protein, variant 2 [Neurospora crassa OR74A]XP_011392805.1 transglutaminase-like protein, variant 3 [Neurospora crassa OR74A]Q7SI01.2 RecName: Full=Protein png-1 [Neurospora crassa OR74A]KHE89814.1 hypothetical protein GE21DRAFT_2074 [Neurospora crassa]ESA44291.1 transglutaminase-like protein [Neurospora crassa OR74A]E|eukprot:XP_011392802.1 transglutaminase-like protein, variant 1 [Neurospora crassa OR74A]
MAGNNSGGGSYPLDDHVKSVARDLQHRFAQMSNRDQKFDLHVIPDLLSQPVVPEPPAQDDKEAQNFEKYLIAMSHIPLNYENPGLLDEALQQIPLDRLSQEAEEEVELFQAKAASLGRSKPEWSHQECMVRALLRWFRRSFFTFVNNPPCSECLSPTNKIRNVAPTPEERAHSATWVELYACVTCGAYERFPRYTEAWQLLRVKRGRAGDFANVFTMLCRALDIRARWVWCQEDYLWTEIYSEHQQRWVHVDSCEEAWDMPHMYYKNWGKKMSYVIAFSREGAVDVTRRYVGSPDALLPRTRCPEGVLKFIMEEITNLHRPKYAPDGETRLRLYREDVAEDVQLRSLWSATLEQSRRLKAAAAAAARGGRSSPDNKSGANMMGSPATGDIKRPIPEDAPVPDVPSLWPTYGP